MSFGRRLYAVSYTHLDVYKRQQHQFPQKSLKIKISKYIPVSYTHLDVYKRQLNVRKVEYFTLVEPQRKGTMVLTTGTKRAIIIEFLPFLSKKSFAFWM